MHPPPNRRRLPGWFVAKLFLCLAFVGFYCLSPAQAPPRSQYVVRQWTADGDLPQNTVRHLWQTQDGYLWIGTKAGLARYDGVRFALFTKATIPEMRAAARTRVKSGGLKLSWFLWQAPPP